MLHIQIQIHFFSFFLISFLFSNVFLFYDNVLQLEPVAPEPADLFSSVDAGRRDSDLERAALAAALAGKISVFMHQTLSSFLLIYFESKINRMW